RRQRWIQAVRRAGPDGDSWQPNSNTRICSRHFPGNARSNIMHHAAYVPTIFPSAYRRTVPFDPSAPTERFQRWQKRPRDQTKSPSEGKVKDTPSSAGGSHQLQLCHDLTDESISLELDESTDDQQGDNRIRPNRGMLTPTSQWHMCGSTLTRYISGLFGSTGNDGDRDASAAATLHPALGERQEEAEPRWAVSSVTVIRALARMSTRTATGPDEVPARLVKCLRPQAREKLADQLSSILSGA
ncbi:hypothetical protein MRX96_046131, partial [Rhipicephalus microplus]